MKENATTIKLCIFGVVRPVDVHVCWYLKKSVYTVLARPISRSMIVVPQSALCYLRTQAICIAFPAGWRAACRARTCRVLPTHRIRRRAPRNQTKRRRNGAAAMLRKKESNKEKVKKLLNYLFSLYWSPRESKVLLRLLCPAFICAHARLITSGHRKSIRDRNAGVDGRLVVYEEGDALSAGAQLHRQFFGEPAAVAVQDAFPLRPTCIK